MRRSGRVVSRNALVHLVWDSHGIVSDNLIEFLTIICEKKWIEMTRSS
jgi:hypothetical protein